MLLPNLSLDCFSKPDRLSKKTLLYILQLVRIFGSRKRELYRIQYFEFLGSGAVFLFLSMSIIFRYLKPKMLRSCPAKLPMITAVFLSYVYLIKIDCPRSHGLTQFQTTPGPDSACDHCHKKYPQNSTMHGCRICNWNVCSACYDGKLLLSHISVFVFYMTRLQPQFNDYVISVAGDIIQLFDRHIPAHTSIPNLQIWKPLSPSWRLKK